ncbi:MAG: hypothetical protein B6241_13390 [Spirochaetaceae bacterium 4572_59]|nr:MAG: hypothetical protein B6241_13390 [Spirochaetaceae bacterium 4572_59]
MKFAMVINVYIDVDEGTSNPFDHPTKLNSFENENTLKATVESIKKLIIEEQDNLTVYIIATATQERTDYDEIIRTKIKDCFSDFPYNLMVYTNADIKKLKEDSTCRFFSVKGYSELRNLGFILPSILKEDIIVQIDDDELLRPLYIEKLKKVLAAHPDKYLFTAPYEKNGTVRILTEDPLKSWKKFSPMDKDMIRFYENSEDVKESLFGFGGNMALRREFAENILYPPEVPRGEDFSMLLASRLVYENGNDLAGIEKGHEIYRSFFLPYKDMTIIHKPPYEAKKDFLKYFENNMTRFIMEWGIFIKQKGLTLQRMKELSCYIKEMIGHEDISLYLDIIFQEMHEHYPADKIDPIKERLNKLIQFYRSFDRWEEYKKNQKEYIEEIRRLQKEDFQNVITDYFKESKLVSQ